MSKGQFTSSTVAFYQKWILIFQIPLQIGSLNLWYIFSLELRVTFFHKNMVTKKIFFLLMDNTILELVK